MSDNYKNIIQDHSMKKGLIFYYIPFL